MKRLSILLLLFFFVQMLTAQTRFSVMVKNYFADFIYVEKPVKGKYFPQAPEKVLEGKKGRFIIEMEDGTPGFLSIHFGEGRRVKVFLESGRTSGMEVDMDNFERSLKFSGPQADQNKFLNSLDRSAARPLFDAFSARSGGGGELRPKDFYLSVVDHIEAEKKILEKKGKKKFSEAFKAALEKDIVFYHIFRFTNMVAKDYQKHKAGQKSRFTSKWAEYWAKAYQISDFSDAGAGVTEYYLLTLDHYLNAYRLGYMEENQYLDPDLKMGEQYLEFDRLMWKDFSGEPLEYGLAGVLSQRAVRGKGEPILYDLFIKFKNDFPNSRYLKPFEKAAAPIGSYLEEEKVKLPAGIVDLGDLGEFHSMADVLRQFEGKVVYMDVWATWCSPCLFEFRQNRPLEEFADGKEIVFLFVSVDEVDRKERWQKIISENKLKGYHIMADFTLRDELISRFGKAGNLALPHYMIFDKSGKLVNGNAKQPSHNSLLFRQLEQYLD